MASVPYATTTPWSVYGPAGESAVATPMYEVPSVFCRAV